MTVDQKSGLLGSNLLGEQGTWDIDIGQMSANGAVHMVMPVSAPVEAACLISKREFQNHPMFGQQVKGSVNRSICDRWVLGAHTLEDFAGGHVTTCSAHFAQDGEPLGGHSNPDRQLSLGTHWRWLWNHRDTYFQLRMTTTD